jgi:hypothetical protein
VTHPNVSSSRHITPRVTQSGLVATLSTANTAVTIQVPQGAVAVKLAFYDNSGNLVRGRVGFSVESTTPTLADGDTTLGYQGAESEIYYLSSWCQHLHVAAPGANTTVRGMWFYD